MRITDGGLKPPIDLKFTNGEVVIWRGVIPAGAAVTIVREPGTSMSTSFCGPRRMVSPGQPAEIG
jgi:hypothetical protein